MKEEENWSEFLSNSMIALSVKKEEQQENETTATTSDSNSSKFELELTPAPLSNSSAPAWSPLAEQKSPFLSADDIAEAYIDDLRLCEGRSTQNEPLQELQIGRRPRWKSWSYTTPPLQNNVGGEEEESFRDKYSLQLEPSSGLWTEQQQTSILASTSTTTSSPPPSLPITAFQPLCSPFATDNTASASNSRRRRSESDHSFVTNTNHSAAHLPHPPPHSLTKQRILLPPPLPPLNGNRRHSHSTDLTSSNVHHPPPPPPQSSPIRRYYLVEFKRFRRDVFCTNSTSNSFKVGDFVKVEADRGEDLGRILSTSLEDITLTNSSSPSVSSPAYSSCNEMIDHHHQQQQRPKQSSPKKILRLATDNELELVALKHKEEEQVLEVCREKVRQRLMPMNVTDAEYQFDRHKLTFFYESDRRIDFRELVRDLFAIYKTRIWMQCTTDINNLTKF